MKRLSLLLSLLLLYLTNTFAQHINLHGEWTFELDPQDVGVLNNWQTKDFIDQLILPGSLSSNNKGYSPDLNTNWTGLIVDSTWFYKAHYSRYREKDNFKTIFWLQPEKHYVGPAWYSRKFTVSKSMSVHQLLLFIERPHWETTVWIDGVKIGTKNALGVPHEYKMDSLNIGEHRITIRVDNRIKDINIGVNAHSVSDHTQTNWNGIIGKIQLFAIPQVTISNVKVYPQIDDKQIRIILSLENASKDLRNVALTFQAISKYAPRTDTIPALKQRYSIPPGQSTAEFIYSMGDKFYKWDEFTPYPYQLSVNMSQDTLNKDYHTTFGMRKLGTNKTQFTINDRLIFMRGTLDCAVFPLTGYPPTDITEWKRIFNIIKKHGLNHVRFHSWCPPKSAFDAADELGLYLQIEGGGWTRVGDGNAFDRWIFEESERIMDTYGNHPSFVLYTYGNEPDGPKQGEFLGDLINHLKKYDNRHLYTAGAGWPDIKSNEFYNAMYPRLYVWGDELKSRNNIHPPSTDFDWHQITDKYNIPYISHEIGQWCAYPNFKEINKYNGVLKPHNFEVFQETLAKNHLVHLADSFLLASGRHQTLTYKAEIEAALRTPGFAGFQLLGLSDFPGQGTALVGVLDAFWEEKGYTTAEEFKTFSGPTVPLLRLPKMTYSNNEILEARVEVAHFGSEALQDIVPTWVLAHTDGSIVASGNLPKQTIPIGNAHHIGHIHYDLSNITVPSILEITIAIGSHRNSWKTWIYPIDSKDHRGNVYITDTLDEHAYAALEKGGSVLFSPAKGKVQMDKGGEIAVGYSPIFWNTAWTKKQAPHVLGVLVNPKHPALKLFPTDYHSDAQWWGLVMNANAMKLEYLGKDVQPIVRVIDDWFTNQSLGMVVEGKLGNGKILICTADLLNNSKNLIEVEQMKKSLLHYMNSDDFNPQSRFNKSNMSAMFP